jgi:hypothetical protein
MFFQALLKSLKYVTNKQFASRYLLLLVLFLIKAFSGYGQTRNFAINKTDPSWIQKIVPKQKRPADKDISEGYFLSFFENQNHIELEEDYTHIIREIVSDAGVQNGSQISVTYDPGFQQLIFHKILIWRDGKSSDRLKSSGFKFLQSEKELSRFIYSGTYDALMVLDDVRKGDRIEFAYTLNGFNPIYGKKYSSTYYFEGSSSIGHIYSNVIFNKSRSLNFRNFNFKDAPEITETGNLKIYEWESTLTKTHRTTDFEPGWYNPLKRTQLSEFSSWSDVVNWGLSVNAYPNLKTPLMDKKVKELKAKAGTNIKEYIKLATRFVQDEVRYMGIEIGAYSHRPNSPEKVLLQRYGDCKDKSLLLVKLLQANGINAYMTYADSYGSTHENDFLPSPFVFNHVIVMVDYDKRKTWIDPTISFQRGDFDDFYAPNYGNVLVIKKGVNALEKIESKPDGKLISNLHFKLADTTAGATTTLEIYSIYTGNYADDMRAQIAESGTDELEKRFLEYFSKMYPEIETIKSLSIEDSESGNMLEITEYYEISDIWTPSEDNEERFAYFYGDLVSAELRKIKGKKRITPIALKHYVNVEQNITVNMPYALSEHDENFKVESDNYIFDVYNSQADSTIKFSYTYRNLTDHVPADQIKNYISDVKKIDEYLTYTVNRGTKTSTGKGVNYYMVLPYLLTLGITAFFFRRLYIRKEVFDIEKIADAIPIGGWLILIGIRMIIFPLVLLIKPFLINAFGTQLWYNLGNFSEGEYVAKTGAILEIIFFAALFTYAIYCTVLFFMRRMEFPKQFTLFTTAYFCFLVYDLFFSLYLDKKDSIDPKDLGGLIGALLYCIIFVWYIAKSERVKQTFVFTYPKFEWESALAQYYEETSFTKEESNDPVSSSNEQNKNREIADIDSVSEKEN